MRDEIPRILKECEVCSINNRKTTGGCDFVATRNKLGKVSLDIMDIGESKRYVLLGIDYFTRRVWGTVLRAIETTEVIRAVQERIKEDGFPEELITYNGKEFCSSIFEKWCSETILAIER